jgi:hypothetical protein
MMGKNLNILHFGNMGGENAKSDFSPEGGVLKQIQH